MEETKVSSQQTSSFRYRESDEMESLASTRLIFLILGVPPHHTKENINKIHTSIAKAGKKGIKAIPLIVSGGIYKIR